MDASQTDTSRIVAQLARELDVATQQVNAAITLLDEGATVPFISRYRKEATGGLDDNQLRELEERLRYLRELEARRGAVLADIEAQGKLTDILHAQISASDTKQRLEDLYLPFRKKRRTRAQMAREAGLEPLADALLADPTLDPLATAAPYVAAAAGIEGADVADAKAALDGAKQILMERFAEDAELAGVLRDRLWQEGIVLSSVLSGKEQEGAKFSDYFEHSEPLAKVPSHRAMAMFRGRNEGVLSLALKLPEELEGLASPAEAVIAKAVAIAPDQGRAADAWLKEVVRWTWRVKLYTRLETELFGRLREQAENGAIQVFAENLNDLLLAAPAGARPTLGLDPGLRTGVKMAVIDATGKFVDHATIYPHAPHKKWDQALQVLSALCLKHKVELIAIGNGTASRETDRLAAELVNGLKDRLSISKVVVNEAGASVYSASAYAAQEFPDLDVTIRGAVSIARRLQDPLAELVKIEPKSIGVGQYQHDVSQVALARSLDAVVEDCVNGVGVDLNTASSALLSHVSGLNATLAGNIVAYRDREGAFGNRRSLLKVERIGPKTFEQCAGFLRINGAKNPLDTSAVHPEAYPVVERIAERHQRPVAELIGDSGFLKRLDPADYTDERFGVPTVTDILRELDKPGRDPRPRFEFAEFREGVESLKDLELDMVLEGVITNVTHFGAFVDIGVHQDGLVHISAMSERFISDPREVVKAGDIVKVKVMAVDVPRKRVGLSMRMSDQAERQPEGEHHTANDARPRRQHSQRSRASAPSSSSQNAPMGALGAALLKAGATRRK